ncbi:AAA family ATPase [Cereibacter changlensis]|uniref:AAA family ATPase n=1 Tax=Cereibacter changlensis TaxID=402884 RepID=UPI004033C617
MAIFLEGVAARFYRGIGPDVQFIAPFSRMNFFIGANNSGKSIVLNLLSSQLKRAAGERGLLPPSGPEEYRGGESGHFVMAIGCHPESVVERVVKECEGNSRIPANYTYMELHLALRRLVSELTIAGKVWVTNEGGNAELYPTVSVDTAAGWSIAWQAMWSSLTGQGQGGLKAHWIPETLRIVSRNVIPKLPKVHLIPAKRALGNKDEAFDDLSGKGLIDHMATLQNPKWDRQENREKFRRINQFVREVTGKPQAELEVPSDREHLLVHMDNKVLPLESLGTGIHEVVLIAAFCTIHDGEIMCIEEPEIHLHPLLQRKLINYIVNETSSQYFIATHSSAFIDTAGANIFHVTNDGVQTRIKPILTKNEQRSVLDDLGYQASDILQSNAVIWVEGPSDRIYLNHWLKAFDSRLEEGIHYTIMFYGGALIRHLTASDDALEEFIKLRDLNRNMAIVMDSDREGPLSKLKPHVQRLFDEMGKSGGIVWVTDGREVENYVDGSNLQKALKAIHSRIYVAPCSTGQYDNSFWFMRENPEKRGQRKTYKDADKVGAASIICSSEADLDILDLRERISELTAMIYKANGMT